MEGTRKRSIAKSIVWRIICIVVSVFTTFFLTGSWNIAVAVGTIYNAITMILYYFHERIWCRIKWGIKLPEQTFMSKEPKTDLAKAEDEYVA